MLKLELRYVLRHFKSVLHRSPFHHSQCRSTEMHQVSLPRTCSFPNGPLIVSGFKLLTKLPSQSSAPDLNTVPPQSIQQASDLADEIVNAANSLISTVDIHALIHLGFTERILQDLQVLVDMVNETGEDIKAESGLGSQRNKEGDVDMDNKDSNISNNVGGGSEADGKNDIDEDNQCGSLELSKLSKLAERIQQTRNDPSPGSCYG
jgi:hypothetical protein